jgi:hypothetical protein
MFHDNGEKNLSTDTDAKLFNAYDISSMKSGKFKMDANVLCNSWGIGTLRKTP